MLRRSIGVHQVRSELKENIISFEDITHEDRVKLAGIEVRALPERLRLINSHEKSDLLQQAQMKAQETEELFRRFMETRKEKEDV